MSIAKEGIPSTIHFETARSTLELDADLRKKIIAETGVLAVFHITKGDLKASYILDFKKDGTIVQGDDETADVTFTLSDESWENLSQGKTGAKWLIFTGKLKYTGSIVTARLVEPSLRKIQDRYKELQAAAKK